MRLPGDLAQVINDSMFRTTTYTAGDYSLKSL